MSELQSSALQADQAWMKQAIALALQGQYSTKPNPNVGCVIVKDGQLLGTGYHPKAGQPHAEVFAMREAGRIEPLSTNLDILSAPADGSVSGPTRRGPLSPAIYR